MMLGSSKGGNLLGSGFLFTSGLVFSLTISCLKDSLIVSFLKVSWYSSCLCTTVSFSCLVVSGSVDLVLTGFPDPVLTGFCSLQDE